MVQDGCHPSALPSSAREAEEVGYSPYGISPSQVAAERFLVDPTRERDACGTGFVADLHGRAAHALLQAALTMIARLAHRGAVAADGKTGDGSGILTQIPHALFARELEAAGLTAPPAGDLAIGMFFLPREQAARERAQALAQSVFAARQLELLMWRQVPVNPEALGEHAFKTRPYIAQAVLARGKQTGIGDAFERALYFARKEIERRAQRENIKPLYAASLSARTLVYKGLFISPMLASFYADLRDPTYATALALVHQRYSTNTFPSWELAQPFRLVCHNGEINTLAGNIAWMNARLPYLASSVWGEGAAMAKQDAPASSPVEPLLDLTTSDSGILDNALELLAMSGRELPHAAMMLLPEAWEGVRDLAPAVKAFYHYHATLMEPWDGPAALCFSDGRMAGMTLDRNGLRPSRYLVTHDGLVVAASEAGALEIAPERIKEKGRLGPGQMVVADLQYGKLWHNDEIKAHYAARYPYQSWVSENIRALGSAEPSDAPAPQAPALALTTLQTLFGYTDEELVVLVRPMAENQAEAIGAMGDDTPHAVLSEFARPLYHFFRQRFAEVTNPPIDPLREELVMSTRVLLGGRGNILEEAPTHARLLELKTPFLTDTQLAQVRALDREFPSVTLNATWQPESAEQGAERTEGEPGSASTLADALDELCAQAEAATRAGKTILILSDRNLVRSVGAPRAPIPMLLAVSAVHHHLLRAGLRWQTSLVAETGDARDVHQFACLIGYGANAINPYLALAAVAELYAKPSTRQQPSPAQAQENYLKAASKGLLKIMSKMGIATLDAYHGAQQFESSGLDRELVARYFTGTPAPVGGIGLAEIAGTVLHHYARAVGATMPAARLYQYGYFKFKKGGEYHAYNPDVVDALHQAVRTPGALNGNYREAYEKYLHFAALVNNRPPTDFSDFLDFKPTAPIPLDRVESTAALVKRFSVAAMSHGALSLEAHQTLSEAMNRLGALANSGEGGEAPARYGTVYNSAIKQVASARFGVTAAYLMSATELQIKMAQGSKPGEGGQLPAHKVSPEIAAIRHAQPGITLISPPPHHDIYSIEDLAQLIYDLKRVNPHARISVKLVAQNGVGTIAAGVAKAYADIIQISGHSGGTGASPQSSIKHAGVAWELGLAETQQVLVANDLRGRVRVRVDGGLKTARHVLIAAMLGADEFSFGTAAVVASGCIMARACHLNTCPVGIATQKQELRRKFPQVAEWVMAYFLFLAEETREYLAALGARTLDEVVGRVDLLEPHARPHRAIPHFFDDTTSAATPGIPMTTPLAMTPRVSVAN